MITAELKIEWNENADLSTEEKKEIFLATAEAFCPPMAIEILRQENKKLKTLLSRRR